MIKRLINAFKRKSELQRLDKFCERKGYDMRLIAMSHQKEVRS